MRSNNAFQLKMKCVIFLPISIFTKYCTVDPKLGCIFLLKSKHNAAFDSQNVDLTWHTLVLRSCVSGHPSVWTTADPTVTETLYTNEIRSQVVTVTVQVAVSFAISYC